MSLAVGFEQLANQRQLGLNGRICAFELQRLVIGFAGETGIHVAEVFVRRGIARVGPDGHLQCRACLVKLILSGIKHGQIVVRLRQFGIVFGQLGEGCNGFSVLAGVSLDHTLEEAHLRVAGVAGQVFFSLHQGLGKLAGAQQLTDITVLICVGVGAQAGGCESQHAKEWENGGADVLHVAF